MKLNKPKVLTFLTTAFAAAYFLAAPLSAKAQETTHQHQGKINGRNKLENINLNNSNPNKSKIAGYPSTIEDRVNLKKWDNYAESDDDFEIVEKVIDGNLDYSKTRCDNVYSVVVEKNGKKVIEDRAILFTTVYRPGNVLFVESKGVDISKYNASGNSFPDIDIPYTKSATNAKTGEHFTLEEVQERAKTNSCGSFRIIQEGRKKGLKEFLVGIDALLGSREYLPGDPEGSTMLLSFRKDVDSSSQKTPSKKNKRLRDSHGFALQVSYLTDFKGSNGLSFDIYSTIGNTPLIVGVGYTLLDRSLNDFFEVVENSKEPTKIGNIEQRYKTKTTYSGRELKNSFNVFTGASFDKFYLMAGVGLASKSFETSISQELSSDYWAGTNTLTTEKNADVPTGPAVISSGSSEIGISDVILMASFDISDYFSIGVGVVIPTKFSETNSTYGMASITGRIPYKTR